MIRKISSVILFACTMAFGQDSAQVNPNKSFLDGLEPTNWSLTSSWRSKYVFSTAVNLHDQPVIQTDLFILTRSGLALDIWTSLPADLQGIGEDFATEIYPTLAWINKIGDYNVSVGVSYEDLHPNFDIKGPDFCILSAEISRDYTLTREFSLSPFFRVETNFTFEGSVNGDTLPKVGTRFAWKLNDTMMLTSKTMLVYDPGILGLDAALVGNAEASLMWKLGESVVMEFPFVRYVEPLNEVNDGRKGEFIFGMGVTLRF